MLGRQPVRVTYAHKRRRVQNASKKLLSSPLEVLPPEVDDLTHTQMARRMLKRSRRVALSNQLEDKNVEHIREHLAKRIKHTQERASNAERSNVAPLDETTFQTPFHSSRSVHDLAAAKPMAPEQLSPVPPARRIMSRTSSRNLKENTVHSQILASPFSSRPGSVASSPKHKGQGKSSHRVSRRSLHVKSRTLSGVFKENARRVSRKGSTVSLKDPDGEPPARHIKHQRYPSGPSASYMRSQFAQQDWIAPPKAFSRTFHDYDEAPSPGGPVHNNALFYTDRPRFCSTPAVSRPRKSTTPHEEQTGSEDSLVPSFVHQEATEPNGVDIEMTDDTAPLRRQTIHLSGNSIFSSSDEFTIESIPASSKTGTTVDKNNATGRGEVSAGLGRQVPYRELVERTRVGRTLAGSFVTEYDIPLSDLRCSPVSTATKILGRESVPKLSVGKQTFDLPGTSPAHGNTLIIHACRNPSAQTPPSSSPATGAACPSSPASDLALEFGSMDVRGDLDTHSDGEINRPSTAIPLQTHSRSLQNTVALADPATSKFVRRRPARNRAGTIRASDLAKPGASPSGTAPPLSNVRRTRSGTVVGPDSKLATKGTLPTRSARGAPARLPAVHSSSESESDDELLLKGPWLEDLEYLGLLVPQSRKEAETDELNLGGPRHVMEFGPPRRLGLRRR